MDLDAEDLGPNTRMALMMVSPWGEVRYQFGNRPARRLFLSSALGGRVLGLIDQTSLVVFMDLQTNALEALASATPGGMRVVSMGVDWGVWQDENGRSYEAPDMEALLEEWGAPVALQAFRQELSFDFSINVFARHLFDEAARCFFKDDGGLRHVLNLVFSYPSGRYVGSRLTTFDRQSGKMIQANDLDRFPLAWPSASAKDGAAAGARPKMRVTPTLSVASFPPAPPWAPPSALPSTPTPSAPASAPPSAPPAHASPDAPRTPRPARRMPGPPSPEQPFPQPPVMEAATAATPAVADFAAPSLPTLNPLEPPPAFSPPPEHRRIRLARRPQLAASATSFTPAAASFPSAAPSAPATSFAPPAPPAPPAPSAPATNVNVATLSIDALLATLAAERDPARRWETIESCLALGPAERVYALIQAHGDVISERARHWPPWRLRAVFAGQPAAALIGMMLPWTIDQAMAVVEASAEPDRVLDWLRDREADRLRRLRPVLRGDMSPQAAREILNVGPEADAIAIEIAWQTLRAFMTVWPASGSARVQAKIQRQGLALLDKAREVLMNALNAPPPR